MLTWLNILHFYQPPTTAKDVLAEVVKSSYQSWADFLNKNKNLEVTVNFTGCLTEMLFKAGYEKLLNDWTKITERGQIEFLDSVAFHPILPLLPVKEIVKQITINHDINRRHFGKIYQPQGFFLPEMAYSEKVGRLIKKMGYKYIILDEIAFNSGLVTQAFRPDPTLKYKIKNIGLYVVFRNRQISQTFVPETILKILEKHDQNFRVVPPSNLKSLRFVGVPRSSAIKTRLQEEQYIITATDGELYGHRYWNWWPAYTKTLKHRNTKSQKTLFGSPNYQVKGVLPPPPLTKGGIGGVNNKTAIKTLTISEYLKSLKTEKTIRPLACSWESTPSELKKGVPYALWYNPKNKIHQLLWQLANFALKLNWQHLKDPNYYASRQHLERGLASCTFWWASGRDFQLYAPPAWNPSMVETGAVELLSSIRSLNKINPQSKLPAEKLFSQVRDLIWKRHWKNGKV